MSTEKKIKSIIIAVGILISAAFYVFSEEGQALTHSGQELEIGKKEAAKADGGEEDELNDPKNANAEKTGEEGENVEDAGTEQELRFWSSVPEEVKREFSDMVRQSVREELISICREGYLEAALQQAAEEAAEEAKAHEGMVNINTADVKELMCLEGIGEKRAKDIVAYREENGGFSKTEDIMNVNGIKESLFQKIREKIYI